VSLQVKHYYYNFFSLLGEQKMRPPSVLALLFTLLLVRQCSTTGRGLGLSVPPAVDEEPIEKLVIHDALAAIDNGESVGASMGQAPGPGMASHQVQASLLQTLHSITQLFFHR
jgi:hypothetical protein